MEKFVDSFYFCFYAEEHIFFFKLKLSDDILENSHARSFRVIGAARARAPGRDRADAFFNLSNYPALRKSDVPQFRRNSFAG